MAASEATRWISPDVISAAELGRFVYHVELQKKLQTPISWMSDPFAGASEGLSTGDCKIITSKWAWAVHQCEAIHDCAKPKGVRCGARMLEAGSGRAQHCAVDFAEFYLPGCDRTPALLHEDIIEAEVRYRRRTIRVHAGYWVCRRMDRIDKYQCAKNGWPESVYVRLPRGGLQCSDNGASIDWSWLWRSTYPAKIVLR